MLAGSSTSIKEYYKKSHAIIVGISNYKEETALSNPYNDASAIKSVLAEKYEFDNIISLLNEQATGEKIRDILEDTLRDDTIIGTQDRVLFYYSGHGKLRREINWRGEEIRTGYIIPYDSRLGKYGSSIKMDDLIQSCQACNAKHIILILDCCYSGYAATKDAEPKVPPRTISKAFLSDITKRKAIQVLAATQSDEPANDSGVLPGFSAFTGALLGILRNEDDPIPNGIITASEIGTVLQQEVVNQQPKGVFQRPSYNIIAGSDGGDFIFKLLPVGVQEDAIEEAKPFASGDLIDEKLKEYNKLRELVLSDLCDDSLWNHIQKLPRLKGRRRQLKVIAPCITVSGVIDKVSKQATGGDLVKLQLDPKFASLLTPGNFSHANGDLIVRVYSIRNGDPKGSLKYLCSECGSSHQYITIPEVGTHVAVTGSYVLDEGHVWWAAINPVTSITVT